METRKRKKNGYGKGVYRSLAMISQFGINMLVPIVMCSFVGIFLDRTFHTSYWMILLFFVGALAGFRNVYVFARRVYEQPPESRYSSVSESGRRSASKTKDEPGADAKQDLKAEKKAVPETNPEQGL